MNAGEDDLLITGAGQLAHLLQHIAWRHAATEPARGRNDAIAASIVAPLLNLQKRPGVPGQRSRSQYRHTALALYIAHRHLSFAERRRLDEFQQIIKAIETDDIIDAVQARDIFWIYLGVAAGDQYLGGGIQALGAAHQLARLPIGAIRHRAGVDDVAVCRIVERHESMIVLQTVLNYRRVVLVDLATECGDRD